MVQKPKTWWEIPFFLAYVLQKAESDTSKQFMWEVIPGNRCEELGRVKQEKRESKFIESVNPTWTF